MPPADDENHFNCAQYRESTKPHPIRIFWKDGHSDQGSDCVPWVVEPVTQATLELLISVWQCTFINYRRLKPSVVGASGPISMVSDDVDLDDGLTDIIERHDDYAEKRDTFPRLSIPSWFEQPPGRQTAKFECNGEYRMLHQRRFSTVDDIAGKVSQLGNRIFYDDPRHRELLFGE